MSEGTSPIDYSYSGQRSISSLGLMGYNARFSGPLLGRFIQQEMIVPGTWRAIGYHR